MATNLMLGLILLVLLGILLRLARLKNLAKWSDSMNFYLSEINHVLRSPENEIHLVSSNIKNVLTIAANIEKSIKELFIDETDNSAAEVDSDLTDSLNKLRDSLLPLADIKTQLEGMENQVRMFRGEFNRQHESINQQLSEIRKLLRPLDGNENVPQDKLGLTLE